MKLVVKNGKQMKMTDEQISAIKSVCREVNDDMNYTTEQKDWAKRLMNYITIRTCKNADLKLTEKSAWRLHSMIKFTGWKEVLNIEGVL